VYAVILFPYFEQTVPDYEIHTRGVGVFLPTRHARWNARDAPWDVMHISAGWLARGLT
jgi:hypothetical protein